MFGSATAADGSRDPGAMKSERGVDAGFVVGAVPTNGPGDLGASGLGTWSGGIATRDLRISNDGIEAGLETRSPILFLPICVVSVILSATVSVLLTPTATT